MIKPFFSILIPVYKNVNYLYECLKSIVEQNYDNFEVILCYQGDTDQKTFIQDTRIRSIYLEKPSLYKARIEAYHEAKGKYVLFVDSDDELLDGALNVLYQTIGRNAEPDIIQFGYTSELRKMKPVRLRPNASVLSRDEYRSYFLSELGTYPIWRKCFKRNNVDFFDEDIFLGEDALLSLAFINGSETIVSIDNTLYFYRPNVKSGTANLKLKYLDDLSIFLMYSFSYRRSERELEMGIYSFISTFFTFLRRFSARDLLSLEHVQIVVKTISTYNFFSKPAFVKKTYLRIVKKNKIGIYENVCLFFIRFMHRAKQNFMIIVENELGSSTK